MLPRASKTQPSTMMTQRECLEQCARLWEHIAKTGHSKKQACEELGINATHNCPCCEYVYQKRGRNPYCANGVLSPKEEGCPLADFWPSGCVHVDSPFWQRTVQKSTTIRSALAMTIANAARAKLAERWKARIEP